MPWYINAAHTLELEHAERASHMSTVPESRKIVVQNQTFQKKPAPETCDFPSGCVTISLNDWNMLVSYVNDINTFVKPLKTILSHQVVGSDAQTQFNLLAQHHDHLWDALHFITVLSKELKRLDGSG